MSIGANKGKNKMGMGKPSCQDIFTRLAWLMAVNHILKPLDKVWFDIREFTGKVGLLMIPFYLKC